MISYDVIYFKRSMCKFTLNKCNVFDLSLSEFPLNVHNYVDVYVNKTVTKII